ncbi:MAG: DNA replication/repair protein RecF [Bacteroidetes bacterium]|nr:DNA replication/repair protein RecF [Bacteroidota bacterium]
MHFKKIRLENFRNHSESSLEFTPGVNLIIGGNAQGKTSILEALSYVCLTKSFLQQADLTVPKFGSDLFAIDAAMEGDRSVMNHARVVYGSGTGKKYFLNRNEIRRSSEVIGMFPIVMLSPGDFTLTTGSPAERRKFADMVLSQISRSYLEELVEYRRALKQRNKILLDGKISNILDKEMLDAWTDALVAHGAKIITKRDEFVLDFQETFKSAYATLVESGEVPGLYYEPSFKASDAIGETFHRELEKVFKVERARGATLVGPHRDDIGFILNDRSLKEFASQGQHKTFLVALKIAEFHYIRKMLGETPVMLLDDVMTELDYKRATRTIGVISGLGQTFITSTDMLSFDDKFLDMSNTKFHFVKEGSVVYENARV